MTDNRMRVSELIELLEKYHPDAPVVIDLDTAQVRDQSDVCYVAYGPEREVRICG